MVGMGRLWQLANGYLHRQLLLLSCLSGIAVSLALNFFYFAPPPH